MGVNGRLVWEHYQEAVKEESIGWEMEVSVISEVMEGCLIEEVWRRWKEKVLAAAEKGIGRKKWWRGQRDGSQTR